MLGTHKIMRGLCAKHKLNSVTVMDTRFLFQTASSVSQTNHLFSSFSTSTHNNEPKTEDNRNEQSEQTNNANDSKTSGAWESYEPNWTNSHKCENIPLRKIWSDRKEAQEQITGKYVGRFGALMMLGGGGGLAYNHLWQYLTMDYISGGLVVGGLLAARYGASFNKDETDSHIWSAHGKEKTKFDFKLLNDDNRYKKEAKELEKVTKVHMPNDLKRVMLNNQLEMVTRVNNERYQRLKEVQQMVSDSMAAGADLRTVYHTLSPRVFVLDFNTTGLKPPKTTRDVVKQFGEGVSLLVSLASPHDEVVVRVTSPGGSVVEFGLAASHMVRLKRAGIPCTACVDTVAASGGYMLACVADRMVAAPFSFLGSIGVITQLFNVHKVLKRNEVETHLVTAGKYKRTLTPFTESTPEAEQKLKEEIEEIHNAFKQHVGAHREGLQENMEDVATGEAWLALHAKERGLVDDLMTSEEYLRSKMTTCDVILVTPHKKTSPLKEFLQSAESAASTWTATARAALDFTNSSKSDYIHFK